MEEKPDIPQTENIVVGKHVPKYKRFIHKHKVVLVAVVLAGLVGAGVWWLFASGHLQYVSSGSSKAVCGSDVVTKYNDAMYYRLRDGSSMPSLDMAGLQKLVSEIKTKANYAKDPTCQTILFWVAVQNDNYNEANTAYKALKTLHDEGKYVDSNLRSSDPFFTYKQYLDNLSGSGVKATEEGVGG